MVVAIVALGMIGMTGAKDVVRNHVQTNQQVPPPYMKVLDLRLLFSSP